MFTSFDKCYEQLGAWFGYWSAQIVKRSYFLNAQKDLNYKKYIGYHHLYLIYQMIYENPRWLYLHRKCVGYRAENESFAKEYGVYQRYRIDLFSYKAIGEEFFGVNSKKVKHILQSGFKKLLLFGNWLRSNVKNIRFR